MKHVTVFAGVLISVTLVAAVRGATARSQQSSTTTPQVAFDVASVKRNIADPPPGVLRGAVRALPGGRLSAPAVSLRNLVQRAYRIDQISGGPDWLNSDSYDVEAKAENPDATKDQIVAMLQSLLEDRFKLKVHREMRPIAVYELTAPKGFSKLTLSQTGGCTSGDIMSLPSPAPGQPPVTPCGNILSRSGNPGRMDGAKVPMAELTSALRGFGRIVIDKTGFTGTFDVHLEYVSNIAADADPRYGTIFTTLQEQLGLKLESATAPIEFLVIDHAERPSEQARNR